jgi:hypothetical protein
MQTGKQQEHGEKIQIRYKFSLGLYSRVLNFLPFVQSQMAYCSLSVCTSTSIHTHPNGCHDCVGAARGVSKNERAPMRQ